MVTAEHAIIPDGATKGSLPPMPAGGRRGRAPDVGKPIWPKREEEAGIPPPPPAGRKQPAAADEQKKEPKTKKKKSPRKGKAGKKGGAGATGKIAREATALLDRERKAANDAADDIKKGEAAAGRRRWPG
jgi:hypothetical protein